MRDLACNRGPASIGTSEWDPGLYAGIGFYPTFYGRCDLCDFSVVVDFDNLPVILTFFCITATEFRPNRSTHCGNDVISISEDGGRDGWILLPVSYLLMSLPLEGQSLSANQILWRYLRWRLRYNYFRFRNTNVRHIGILLLISNPTSSPQSACYSASGYRISSKLEHPLRKYDVISISQHDGCKPATAKYYFRFVYIDVTAFRRSKSISKPNFVEISQLSTDI